MASIQAYKNSTSFYKCVCLGSILVDSDTVCLESDQLSVSKKKKSNPKTNSEMQWVFSSESGRILCVYVCVLAHLCLTYRCICIWLHYLKRVFITAFLTLSYIYTHTHTHTHTHIYIYMIYTHFVSQMSYYSVSR